MYFVCTYHRCTSCQFTNFREIVDIVYKIELVRFQNSSVSVLNLNRHSVPVLTGSTKNEAFGSGFSGFGFTVLTVLTFSVWYLKICYFCQKNRPLMHMNHLLCEIDSNSPIKLLLLYMNLYSFWWKSFKFAQNRQIWWIFWWNCSFRVLAVLNFGFGSFSGTGFSIVSVLFRFRFWKNGSKPSVFRFRLKPNQL